MLNWCGYKWESVMEGGRRIHPGNPWMWYCDDCSWVDSDDVLHLKIEEKPIEIHHWDGKVYHPTIATGIIRSRRSFSYGTFSADVQLPEGTNLWPSFWTSGDKSWPPEIDIMEAWSDSHGKYFRWTIPQFPYLVPSWKTTTNIHYNTIVDSEGSYIDGHYQKTSIGSRNVPWCKQHNNPSKNFINYKVEWFPDVVRFYANGKLVREVSGSVPNELTQNNSDPDFRMDVIFNVWCENPDSCNVSMSREMLVKNFKYTPYAEE